MTKKTILIIFILALTVYGLFVLNNWRRGIINDKVETIYLDTIDDLTANKKIDFETKGTITGIEIYVEGEIKGTGTLTISYNDSTFYRKYELASGKIDIEHKSDWYSEKCSLTFMPTTPTKGKLEISCNFIGD